MKNKIVVILCSIVILVLATACSGPAENRGGETQEESAAKTEIEVALTAHYLDVGQADATLVEFDEYAILIDAGDWGATDVVDYLKKQGISELDIVVGTHPDADHIGQLARVVGEFEVGEVWMSGNPSTSNTYINALQAVDASGTNYYEPRTGDVFEIGSMKIEVLNPSEITGKANEESISLKMTYGDIQFVFTGDAGVQEEQKMIDSDINLEAEILQLGHHGSNTSTSRAFLKAVSPEVAIYSAGADNSYGHPHAEVIAATENEGAEVFGTDVNGTILVETDGETYQVKTEKEGVPIEGVNRCIDINIASTAELEEITGIGPAYAEAIINERPFETVDQLTAIKGIGAATIDGIKEQGLVCIGGIE